MAIEKNKILGAVLELLAKQHCQLGQFGQILRYSSVPNRRVGQNKRAGGKILRKH